MSADGPFCAGGSFVMASLAATLCKLTVWGSHRRAPPKALLRRVAEPCRFSYPDSTDFRYSTVTLLARLRGWSTSVPFETAA
jgi:hypothetical protein